MSDPFCPMCNGNNLTKLEDKLFRCNNCNMLTDGIDDGDVGYKPPSRNASKKEEYEKRKADRERRQRENLTRPRRLR